MASAVPAASGQGAEVARPVENRAATRTITLHRASAIEAARGRGLGIIRNLSTQGAMVETIVPLAVDDALDLVVATGVRIPARVRWVRDGRAGLEFERKTPLSHVLDRSGGGEAELRRRMPRLTIAQPVAITDASGTWQGTTIDISTHGLRLACDDPLALGRVRLDLPGLPPIGARVLRRQRTHYGCLFDRPFGMADVTAWLHEVERR
jgi:hypothetical protein|nr:PilZ domain-containing protein [Sphingomonas corticis]